MNWLKDDIGFEGWRFDFVKGYAPEFMQDYCGKTVGNDAWNVGEYWADMRSVTVQNNDDQCPSTVSLRDLLCFAILQEVHKHSGYV